MTVVTPPVDVSVCVLLEYKQQRVIAITFETNDSTCRMVFLYLYIYIYTVYNNVE